ncbi:MFS transporter [Kibdelosporangium phytohabitans]|uniref:MFS transporter n=1 Tax=Kibdelosporangium phytohabitans TaxID=860235 RepID=A0A0N7F2H1_9PSEU|nr:MFS transporter [Kibdelosporangium phytohabitans]ALG05815.1 MFS transporter [Kibdelosporangium phytohabitans]MBE1466167.1 MFS family permease [Kibdelosporangium phytohabitans]
MTSATVADRRSLWRAFTASLSGTSLEWYDFAAYSVASATIFGPLFFPGNDPLASTMLAFSTYAVGYVARPLGGFVFGRLGDVIGRKRVLVITLVLTGTATFLIGVLPTYATIGSTAAILLVLLRFAQGVGIGGEWGGAVLLSSEFGDQAKRGFWASAAQIGPPAGNLMANGVLALLGALLTEEEFIGWGWRLAFLLSAVLIAFGLWIRVRLEETPVFKAIEAKGARPSAPISEVFRDERRGLLAGVFARVCPDVHYALFTVFVLTYATRELNVSRGWAMAAVLISSALQLVLIPAFGALSDRVNRRKLYLVATIGAAVWPWIFFPMISGGSVGLLILGVVVALVLHSAMYGPQAAFVTEQFSERLRYTGSSMAYTLAGVIGGAVAPLLFTALLSWTGSWPAIAGYIVLTSVVTVIGLALGRDPVSS